MTNLQRDISEAAVRFVRHTYADYAAGRNRRAPLGRVLVTATALGSYDALAARQQACYLRLISIVEAYADVLNRVLLGEKLSMTDELVPILVEEIERKSTGWGDRVGAFKTFHAIRLKKCSSWQRFESGTDVRNTIAHGLGRLTVRQSRNADLPMKLAAIDVYIRDGRLALDEKSLATALSFCLAMIAELDAAAAPA